MFGIVVQNIPFEKMYFLHKGELKNGQEQKEVYDENAIENYDLSEKDGVTSLTVTMNAPEEYIPYFTQTFPPALEKLKEIAENL